MGQALLLAPFLHPKKISRDVRQLTHYFVDPIINVHWFLCSISSALQRRNKKLVFFQVMKKQPNNYKEFFSPLPFEDNEGRLPAGPPRTGSRWVACEVSQKGEQDTDGARRVLGDFSMWVCEEIVQVLREGQGDGLRRKRH